MAADVVVGAASGMGAAVARRLAGSGRRLVLADLDVAGAERLGAELAGEVGVRRCDITERADVEALAEAAGELGRLVLTAGVSPTMAPGRRIFAVDAVGPATLVEVFGSRVGEGSVAVLLSSMAGHLAPAQPEVDAVLDRPLEPSFLDDLAAAGVDVDDPAVAYTYGKRAVLRLVRRASKAWGERGARLLSLSPGIVDTPMGRQEYASQPIMAEMVAASALGRMIVPEEVAAVVEFLVSPAASALTGTDVLVDGGTLARFAG